ncbi:Serine acetyltransferase [Posidoniimonas corsicana]|uniref:Serine acetyltransferase n=1 Tax=Posidoniimonas corsicana TaxID=1938618 RepID=A0A5C5V0D4_9BACT|nr:serine O-acetyltransferase EpsC [Posidoniimonas corsicana]TWT31185.1 Serine acetyltransferase [Posidoniimonas corsicana]
MATDFRLKERLPRLTDRLVETYSQHAIINHLDHCPLPKYEAVIDSIQDLKEILFPGYRRREGLHHGNIEYYVGDLVDRLHDALTKQVGRALLHEAGGHCEDGTDFEALGQAKVLEFLDRLPQVRAQLATDVQAAYDGDPACKCPAEVIFCYPGLEAVTVHRLAHELYKLEIPFIPRMMAEWSHARTGIDIHPGATIGEYFFIDHGTGVVIGETCRIGDHVKIYQGVTLGAVSFPTDENGQLVRDQKRHPTIEDHVVVYANATILGGRTVIGEGSVIGSSVWLTKSVAPNTTVTMEAPSLRIRNEDADALKPEVGYQI